MTIDIERVRAYMRQEDRWFMFLAPLAASVLFSAGVAFGYFFPFGQSSPPVVIIFQPGSIVMTPTPAK